MYKRFVKRCFTISTTRNFHVKILAELLKLTEFLLFQNLGLSTLGWEITKSEIIIYKRMPEANLLFSLPD